MNLSLYFEEAAQVSVAFVIGAVIGLEREFRSKPAGFINYDAVNHFLLQHKEVKSFEV